MVVVCLFVWRSIDRLPVEFGLALGYVALVFRFDVSDDVENANEVNKNGRTYFFCVCLFFSFLVDE